MEVFAERGFGATRVEDIARRAGVSKGTLFVYFATKEELFRAVAQTVLSSHLVGIKNLAVDPDRPLRELVPELLAQLAKVGETGMPAMARLLIAESRKFPELARIWYEEVASKVILVLRAAIERAQARGEIGPGDPALYAFSIVGPMMAAVLFREVFGASGLELPDLRSLAKQHSGVVLEGLLSD